MAHCKQKPILCLDFDGVCHSYTSGWQGAEVIPDPPVDGLCEFILQASEEFDVQVYSSRSSQLGGIEAMQEWLLDVWIRHWDGNAPHLFVTFPREKPAAFLTIDDRAITFRGKFPSMNSLKSFKPWRAST